MRRTKIICTIGPASEKAETMRSMIRAGMNYARLNFSHGNRAYHKKLITNIRKAAALEKVTIGIIADLGGSKIRLGKIASDKVILKKNDQIVFGGLTAKFPILPQTYSRLHKDTKVGSRILVGDGAVELKIIRISGQKIFATVIFGGEIVSGKGLTFPDSKIKLQSLPRKDRHDIKFAITNNVEWIAQSFVRDASDVLALRKCIGKNPQKIIVKIEQEDALKNLEGIIKVADGIMVARGDLGLNIPQEQLPAAQKNIIRKSLLAGKPVIVATEMLESMTHNPRPTRAEISDVANAVIDHADALMLSGETAVGAYPTRTVSAMARIIKSAEESPYDDLDISFFGHRDGALLATAESIAHLGKESGARAILIQGRRTRDLAETISSFRQERDIFIKIKDAFARRQIFLHWGVRPAEELKNLKLAGPILLVNARAAPEQIVIKFKTLKVI